MKTGQARRLVDSLIVDIDGVIAHQGRPPEERHSAAASAAILTARLLGGMCINLARLTHAVERLADAAEDMTPENEE